MSNNATPNSAQKVPVWDFFVRAFHWFLVAFFILAYVTAEDGGELHEVAGYTVLGLISARVLWGFVGSKYARFSEFLQGPAQVIAYLKGLLAGKPAHYFGHNPAGGWMVMALLLMLFVVTLSGLKLEFVKEAESVTLEDKARTVISEISGKEMDSEQEEYWEEIHEAATDILLVLIGLHVLGVVVSGRMHKENLVKAMITGKKDRQ